MESIYSFINFKGLKFIEKFYFARAHCYILYPVKEFPPITSGAPLFLKSVISVQIKGENLVILRITKSKNLVIRKHF